MRRRAFLQAIGSAALMPAFARATDGDPRLIDTLDLAGAPGVAIGVVHAGRIVAIEGRGRRGPADVHTPGPDTVFEIGSLTKTFTAGLIAVLASEGRLDIDASIGRMSTICRMRGAIAALPRCSAIPAACPNISMPAISAR